MDKGNSAILKRAKSHSSLWDEIKSRSTLSSNQHADSSPASLSMATVSSKANISKRMKKYDQKLSVDDLIDHCWIAVLDRMPFKDLFTSVPLTCKRWNDLLKVVHLQKSTLVVWNEGDLHDDPFLPMNRSLLVPLASFDRFEEYLAILINDSNTYWLYMRDITTPSDYWIRRTLDAFDCIQIVKHFPNLTHLSLIYVYISYETLAALLRAFQWQLEELFLHDIHFKESQKLNLYEQAQLVKPILPLIDGMPSLRQLAFSNIPAVDDIAAIWSNVLPRLEELQLQEYDFDIYSILRQMNERTLKRLDLEGTHWPNPRMLSRLVAGKPALRDGLTHLTIGRIHDTDDQLYSQENILLIIEQIGNLFSGIEYLDIRDHAYLSDILPHLCKLENLVHLRICLSDLRVFDVFGPHSYWTDKQRKQYALPSLQVFVLEYFLIDLDRLSILTHLFPNLCQLYFTNCRFQCQCVSEPETFELPCERPVGCSCKPRIIKFLNSFKRFPTMEVSYSLCK